jgi:hypothetical protein
MFLSRKAPKCDASFRSRILATLAVEILVTQYDGITAEEMRQFVWTAPRLVAQIRFVE